MIGHHDHGVLLQEPVHPTARVHHALQLGIGERDRVHLTIRARAVRVPVVVGQRQQHEVEQVMLDHVGTHTTRMLVAHPRHPQV